jgi:hypothetical protein
LGVELHQPVVDPSQVLLVWTDDQIEVDGGAHVAIDAERDGAEHDMLDPVPVQGVQ